MTTVEEQPDDPIYQIRVGGHLNGGWSEWLDEMTLTAEPDGTTVMTGPVADQPALYGLLIKLRDLGLPLLSVARRRDRDHPDPGVHPGQNSREEPGERR